jgi:hypothetical protein
MKAYSVEIICMITSLLIGIVLFIGTYNRWNWLVSPPKKWWFYPPSLLNRLFGSWILAISNYFFGFMFFAIAFFILNGGLRYIYYQTTYVPPSRGGSGWNVYSGVSLESTDACSDTKGKSFEIRRTGKEDLIVNVTDLFYCDRELIDPYLSVGIDNKYTLKLGSKFPIGFLTACDCTKALTIKISNRLPKDATLYVSNDDEVLGHFIVP